MTRVFLRVSMMQAVSVEDILYDLVYIHTVRYSVQRVIYIITTKYIYNNAQRETLRVHEGTGRICRSTN